MSYALAICGVVCSSSALAHFIPGRQWVLDVVWAVGEGAVEGLASGYPVLPSEVLFLVFYHATECSTSEATVVSSSSPLGSCGCYALCR